MITNRENLIYLSREVERVTALRTRAFQASTWGPNEQATTLAMQMALDSAHLAFGFGDDAEIAQAIKQLREFEEPEIFEALCPKPL